MIYFLIIVYMFLLPITVILCLIKILDMIYELKKEQIEAPKESSIQKRRTHRRIAPSDYGNSFNKRVKTYDYSEYKNKKGLYEPVQPHRGIKLSENHEKEE